MKTLGEKMRNGNIIPLFVSGVIVGVIMTGFIATVMGAVDAEILFTKYATISVGLIATTVAWLTYYFHLNRSTGEENRRRRRARAMLGVDLSTLSQYAERSMDLADCYDQWTKTGKPPAQEDVRIPAVPESTLDRISIAAGDLNSPSLELLIHHYQVHHSRLKGLSENLQISTLGGGQPPSPKRIEMAATDAARLAIMVENSFEHARENIDFRDHGIPREDIDKKLEFRRLLRRSQR